MPKRVPYEPGDVVWGPDPYHTGDVALETDAGRPWLVVSLPQTFPNHGTDYLCLALTSVPPPRGDRHRIPLDEQDWVRGRPPKRSHVDTQTILTITHEWFGDAALVGHVRDARLYQARRLVKAFF